MNPISPSRDLVSLSPPITNMGNLSSILYPGVTLEHAEIAENGRTGSESTYVYHGTYLALKGQQNWCRGWGAYSMALTRIEGSSHWRLTAVFPFNEYGGEPQLIQGVYELDVEMQQPSIYTSEVLRGKRDAAGNMLTAALLPDNYIAVVARYVEYFSNGEASDKGVGLTNPDSGWSWCQQQIMARVPTTNNYQARALQLFATVAAHKTDSFIEYYHVFKRTLTAALPVQVQASNIGKGQIWTTFELQNFEGVPANSFFQLDQNSLWLKSPPVISASARQKTQVSYSYTECRQANALAYTAYGAAKLLYASPTDLPPIAT